MSSIPIGQQGHKLVEHGNQSHQHTTLSVPLDVSPHFATTIALSGPRVEDGISILARRATWRAEHVGLLDTPLPVSPRLTTVALTGGDRSLHCDK